MLKMVSLRPLYFPSLGPTTHELICSPPPSSNCPNKVPQLQQPLWLLFVVMLPPLQVVSCSSSSQRYCRNWNWNPARDCAGKSFVFDEWLQFICIVALLAFIANCIFDYVNLFPPTPRHQKAFCRRCKTLDFPQYISIYSEPRSLSRTRRKKYDYE